MWRQQVGGLLERATRSATIRRMARAVANRGLRPPPRLLERLHIDKSFEVCVGPGLGKFRYATDGDAVGRHLYWGGLTQWERESWQEFIPLAQKARGFADVGAFTGAYSLVAATVNNALHAISFEPVPAVFRSLERNIELNHFGDRVIPIAAAVSDNVGTDRFFIPDREMPDTGFLQSSNRVSQERGDWHEVQTTTLEDAMPSGFHLDLMKIDVEDAEGPVVASMASVIEAHRPTIIIEFLSSGSYDLAVDVLEELGYDFFHLTKSGRVAVPRPIPDDVHFNFLCVPR